MSRSARTLSPPLSPRSGHALAPPGSDAGVREELVGLLIHAHHRNARVMRVGVEVEDVFHPGGELAVRMEHVGGWDGPALLQVRTKRPLFRVLPMVEWSR